MDIHTIDKKSDKSGTLKRLSHFDNAPKRLYVFGKLPELSQKKLVTIVGSRIHHPDSMAIIKKIVKGLSGYPIVIVSGLALGIDGIAHRAALEHGLATIAFPGSGLENIYPASHTKLAQEIIASGGALISEFSNQTKAARWTFPLRNRLMAQCADLVLVIEASDNSGTLITARHALEAGVTVGAIPHSPLNTRAIGTNKLLQDGAFPIIDHTDVLRLLNIEPVATKDAVTHLPEIQQILLRELRVPTHKHDLFEAIDISYEVFIQTISELEIGGYISERMGVITRS